MPLVFHEMGHSRAGVEAGASVEVFLEGGLVSKALLRESGKLPPTENLYERALALTAERKEGAMQKAIEAKEAAMKKREAWRLKKTEDLKDNPSLLEGILSQDKISAWWNPAAWHKDDEGVGGHEIFHKPGHPAHREENVFFGYSEHPSSNRDWVAIEVSETATLHDASCRDRGLPDEWLRTAVTIRQFSEMQARGEMPSRWESTYNEHLIRDRVPAEKIVAYAKMEKELPVEKPITAEELEQVQNFVSNKLGFATQFDDPKDNVLVHESAGKYQVRVSFNKEKVTGREGEVSAFFDKFESMGQLVEAAQSREVEVVGITPRSEQPVVGSHTAALAKEQKNGIGKKGGGCCQIM